MNQILDFTKNYLFNKFPDIEKSFKSITDYASNNGKFV